jgi:hypothetical protein
MRSLYLTGGRQRKLLFKNEEEQRLYEAALILRLDPTSDASELKVEYKSPPEARASEETSDVFKSSTIVGSRFYTCTSTEVLVYEMPEFRRISYVSLPCFNDLHHVTPTRDGNLLVAVTGLDMVVKFTPEGKVLNYWNVLGKDPWARFSPEVDYRKVESTKPHDSHPNAAFELGDDVWVTRLQQRDAICLTRPGLRINIEVQRPHDGLLWNGQLYFTTVDGRIVIANPESLQVERIVDLHEIHRNSQHEDILLGWCRGILPVDERRIWVGFTRVRKTMFMENVLWIKKGFQNKSKPTHLGLYDIAEQKCLQEIDLEGHGMNVIFGIYDATAPGTGPER